MTEISPAILSDDISDFRKKYAEVLALSQHFKQLHVDFADGKFVPHKTVKPSGIHFLKSSPVALVAHLMTVKPGLYFDACKRAGFSTVLFHYEACRDGIEVIHLMHKADVWGMKSGLVINPETSLTKISGLIPHLHLIQIMGIHPGAQGRAFIPSTVEKIQELRALSKSVIICVDGGVRVGIARQCVKAGADILVSGSAILRSEDPAMAIESLKLDIES